jgi:hypothetical protein
MPLRCRGCFFITDDRSPWTSDQLVARPLHKHGTTLTQNKHIPNIHALCGIRTHDPGFRTSKDSQITLQEYKITSQSFSEDPV